MKTTLLALVLALTGLELWAQTPPGPPDAAARTPGCHAPRYAPTARPRTGTGPATDCRCAEPRPRTPLPARTAEEMIPAGHD